MPGSNPPTTVLTEVYEPPFDRKTMTGEGFTVRTLDLDRKGVVWVTLTGSSHLASFDRTKCKGPLNGPTATGQHCREGWTLYPLPGPKFKGDTVSVSTEATYINWVDQFDTLGLGKDTPITVGNSSDSLHALVNGKFVTLRVPYPMGFYAKGVDGRIDDPKTGWKGKGLWVGLGHPRAVPPGRRRGHEAEARAVPASSGPAREVGQQASRPGGRAKARPLFPSAPQRVTQPFSSFRKFVFLHL